MASGDADPIITVSKLRKVFNPDIVAVDDVSFSVTRGQIFGFLGPNGAGKTTTIRMLATLLQPSGGTMRIDGLDPVTDAAAVRRMIGYGAQDIGVDGDLTARENLRLMATFYHLPKREAIARTEELLTAVDLQQAADRPAMTYSGGMRRRLDLACALVPRPKVLFLDEPTTGLDPQNRTHMWDYVRGLNESGTTIFLTTQYMEEADKLAHQLCIIDMGRIVAEGTPKELKAAIGADVIQLRLPHEGLTEGRVALRAALAAVAGISDMSDYDEGVAVYAKDGPGKVAAIVRALDDAKIGFDGLNLSAPSLDDVFVKHTGRTLRVESVKPTGRTPWGGPRGPKRR